MWTKRKKYLYLFAGWLVFTFVLTSIPLSGGMRGFYHLDKVAHFLIYGMSGFLFASYLREGNLPREQMLIYTILVIGLVGAVDEIHQMWISGRASSLYDWMADVSGGGMGFVALLITEKAGISWPFA